MDDKRMTEEQKQVESVIEAFPFERSDIENIRKQIKNGNLKTLINKLLTIARDTQRHLHQVEELLEDIRKDHIK